LSNERSDQFFARRTCRCTGQKGFFAVELATLFLDRIDRLNPGLNAFIALDRDKTLAQAKAADAALAKSAPRTRR
jgi:Asp-tRNA(Asn)/Glu-tRNA(Gln) amidotransferase A subunit family amidase